MQPTPTITAQLEKVREHLAEEGFRPKIKKDDLVLTYRGWTVVVTNDCDDTDYYYVLVPYFWEIESNAERLLALETASEMSRLYKVAKLFVTSDNANVSSMTGIFSKSPEAFCEVVVRHISVAVSAVEEFRKAMNERSAAAEPPAPEA
jgi:hypothetical protein